MAIERCLRCGFRADNIIDEEAGIYECPVCGEVKNIVHESCQFCLYYDEETNRCNHPQSYKLNELVHPEFYCNNYEKSEG